LLISQSSLIRFKKFELHKRLGKVAYVLGPVLIVTGVSAVHYSVRHAPEMPTEVYYASVWHVYNAILTFAIMYSLAIWHIKDSPTHARYMICTMFPAFTPVFSRIISTNFSTVLPVFPTLNGFPLVQVFGFGLADAILITLIVLDQPNRKSWQGFPLALAIMFSYHVSDFILYRFEFFRDIADWVGGLPLS
jgi:hypothetical protein